MRMTGLTLLAIWSIRSSKCFRDAKLQSSDAILRLKMCLQTQVTGNRDVRIELRSEQRKDELVERDPIQLAIFSHRRAPTVALCVGSARLALLRANKVVCEDAPSSVVCTTIKLHCAP